jgi:OmpA-OmpF porin, OOP family
MTFRLATVVASLALTASTAALAIEVTPIRGYRFDDAPEVKNFAQHEVYIECGTKLCGNIAPGKFGYLKLEGKSTIYKVRAVSAQDELEDRIINQEYAAVAKKAGGAQIDVGSRGGPNVFRIPRANQQGVDWIVIRHNYGRHFEMLVVEEASHEVTAGITASQMGQSIDATGSVALYIEFDTAKATLKPAGDATVKEIAALLKSQPALRLSVEGHTDNVGQAADNKRLSQARAEAVMKAVVAQGIDAKRLKAVGQGQEYPIADNRTEEGRGKNRRVELVKMK